MEERNQEHSIMPKSPPHGWAFCLLDAIQISCTPSQLGYLICLLPLVFIIFLPLLSGLAEEGVINIKLIWRKIAWTMKKKLGHSNGTFHSKNIAHFCILDLEYKLEREST